MYVVTVSHKSTAPTAYGELPQRAERSWSICPALLGELLRAFAPVEADDLRIDGALQLQLAGGRLLSIRNTA